MHNTKGTSNTKNTSGSGSEPVRMIGTIVVDLADMEVCVSESTLNAELRRAVREALACCTRSTKPGGSVEIKLCSLGVAKRITVSVPEGGK